MLKNRPSRRQIREEDLNRVAQRYAVRITPAAYETMGAAENDPVARQYIPDLRELTDQPDELTDPIGDETHEKVPGIIHRYPDRVLLLPVKSCAVYCRYCFRREKVGKGENMLDEAQLEKALAYIRDDENIWEVILSGGDPLILSPRRLQMILRALDDIPHVQVIRIHSRVPVADPDRVTAALCAALQIRKALYIALHINHAQEISAKVENVCRALHMAGAVLLSQTVLLAGINDKPETLETLFRALAALRVKPYYLHHPDKARGTSHFRVSIARGQEIITALRGRLSGLCQPTYMLDLPGGHGKVALTPCTHTKRTEGEYEIEDYQGCKHIYRD